MNIIPLLILFSLGLAACGAALFVFSARNRDHEHVDRLSLLPLEDDLEPEPSSSPSSGNQDRGDLASATGRGPSVEPHD